MIVHPNAKWAYANAMTYQISQFLVNGFGTGVADDKLIHGRVEDMIRFYLDAEPLLQPIPTHALIDPLYNVELEGPAATSQQMVDTSVLGSMFSVPSADKSSSARAITAS